MSESIITQIKAEIEKAAERYAAHTETTSMAENYRDGANFILPLLERAIKQRNGYMEYNNPESIHKDIMKTDDEEILKELKNESR